jgi:hypothetical protein
VAPTQNIAEASSPHPLRPWSGLSLRKSPFTRPQSLESRLLASSRLGACVLPRNSQQQAVSFGGASHHDRHRDTCAHPISVFGMTGAHPSGLRTHPRKMESLHDSNQIYSFAFSEACHLGRAFVAAFELGAIWVFEPCICRDVATCSTRAHRKVSTTMAQSRHKPDMRTSLFTVRLPVGDAWVDEVKLDIVVNNPGGCEHSNLLRLCCRLLRHARLPTSQLSMD